jgi:hypothetical protein
MMGSRAKTEGSRGRRLLSVAVVAFLGWGLTVVATYGLTHLVEALLITAALSTLTVIWVWLFPIGRRDS